VAAARAAVRAPPRLTHFMPAPMVMSTRK
jgi:hypothetical protein